MHSFRPIGAFLKFPKGFSHKLKDFFGFFVLLRNSGPSLRNSGPSLRNSGPYLRNSGPSFGRKTSGFKGFWLDGVGWVGPDGPWDRYFASWAP